MTDTPPITRLTTPTAGRAPVEKDKMVLALFGAVTFGALLVLYLGVKAQDILAIITPVYTALGVAFRGDRTNGDG